MNEGSYPQAERGVDEMVSNRRSTTEGTMSAESRPQLSAGANESAMPSSQPKPREILIQPKDHGFIVTVGCQTFAIEKVSTLIRNIEKYLERPAETEKKWMDGKLEL